MAQDTKIITVHESATYSNYWVMKALSDAKDNTFINLPAIMYTMYTSPLSAHGLTALHELYAQNIP